MMKEGGKEGCRENEDWRRGDEGKREGRIGEGMRREGCRGDEESNEKAWRMSGLQRSCWVADWAEEGGVRSGMSLGECKQASQS